MMTKLPSRFLITILIIILSNIVVAQEANVPPNVRDLAFEGVKTNAGWEPYIQEVDGVEMALVPAGCFLMGSEDGSEAEQPVHEQCFEEPFWMDVYEVSNAQFDRFEGQAEQGGHFSGDNRPREQITWPEASAFCHLRDGRLPREHEWEYAARGPDNLVYPWGDEFSVDDVANSTNTDGETTDVGSFPEGISWVGTLDMSGNVWEWMNTAYKDYPYLENDGRENAGILEMRVLRGGSWRMASPGAFRAARRSWYDTDLSEYATGFRCVRNYVMAD